jgi:hypothetical protein
MNRPTIQTFGLVACLLLGSGFRPAPRPSVSFANTTILIIRHGEKPEEGVELAPAGQRRAQAYVKYFADFKLDGSPLHLSHIFATKDSKSSHRETLTIAPLAKALGLSADARFKNAAVDDLASAIKSEDDGTQILICWHHGRIPDLITALGGDPKSLLHADKWPSDHFDWVVELQYDGNGRLIRQNLLHEHLMPGDSN